MKPIPTTYGGVRFRSRLEAKWAAFFDLVGWPWTYEPIDLEGYIPDFVLRLDRPVLVEVKPIVTRDQRILLEEQAAQKIERCGWRDEAIIVGTDAEPHRLGLIGEHDQETRAWRWDRAFPFVCPSCSRRSFCQARWSIRCRASGCNSASVAVDVRAWDPGSELRAAQNTVQWKAEP